MACAGGAVAPAQGAKKGTSGGLAYMHGTVVCAGKEAGGAGGSLGGAGSGGICDATRKKPAGHDVPPQAGLLKTKAVQQYAHAKTQPALAARHIGRYARNLAAQKKACCLPPPQDAQDKRQRGKRKRNKWPQATGRDAQTQAKSREVTNHCQNRAWGRAVAANNGKKIMHFYASKRNFTRKGCVKGVSFHPCGDAAARCGNTAGQASRPGARIPRMAVRA